MRVLQLQPGALVGEYRVIQRVASGGMGTIYSAEHPIIGKKVAIKVIRPNLSRYGSSVERFLQEARAVTALGHPNIVDIFAFGTLPDGRSYFVMEWLVGENLYERITRAPIDLREAIVIIDQIADALEAVHDKGMIHRDLKPENVFLVPARSRRPWRVKLLDFGVAKLLRESGTRRLTLPGVLLGTAEYVAPEQVQGAAITEKTDIYSFACLAYDILSGRPPFEDPDLDTVLMAHVNQEPPVLRHLSPLVPEELSDLLHAMLAKEPERRPSLSELRDLLHALGAADTGRHVLSPTGDAPAVPLLAAGSARVQLVDEPPPPPPAPVTAQLAPEAPRRRGHKRLALAALAALTVIAGVAVAWPRAARPASVVIEMDVAARVEIDGDVFAEGTRVRIRAPAGEHVIEVTAPGRKTVRRTVSLRPGATTMLFVPMARE